ncbi:MAG: hypothetical protein AB7E42_02610 [Anaerotignaceae bacterium]
MEEFYNKHYVRLDTDGRIIKGFSDAFEQPIEGDICINEQGGRHFEMFGVVNPPLMNMQGIYIYKYIDEVVMERTPEEIQADISNLPQSELSDKQKLETAEDTIEVLLTQILPMLA